jgi:putative acetyltransferase
MNKVAIRTAGPSDALGFLETLNASIRGVASADYPPEIIESWSIPIGPKSLSRYADNPEGELRILAEIGDEVVGIGATVLKSCELRACYLAPNGLRRGVGTALVQELERIAKAEGLEHFHLTGTITAEPFYNALGYTSLQRVETPTRGGLMMAAIKMRKQF